MSLQALTDLQKYIPRNPTVGILYAKNRTSSSRTSKFSSMHRQVPADNFLKKWHTFTLM